MIAGSGYARSHEQGSDLANSIEDWASLGKEIACFFGRGKPGYLNREELAVELNLHLSGNENSLKEIVDLLGVVSQVYDFDLCHAESESIFFRFPLAQNVRSTH